MESIGVGIFFLLMALGYYHKEEAFDPPVWNGKEFVKRGKN